MPDVLPPAFVPAWELRFPGRLGIELRWLTWFGATFQMVIDHDFLDALVLDVDWPARRGATSLRVVFPAEYPDCPPLAFLRGRPYPLHHCCPIDGELCLLGRGGRGRQWDPGLTTAQLIAEQLDHALDGTGTEEPQGEPAEVWWNSLALPGSYILVDSSWDLGEATGGTLKILYDTLPTVQGRTPVRAAIGEVLDWNKRTIGQATSRPPAFLQAASSIVWTRRPGALLPKEIGQGPDLFSQLPHDIQNRVPKINLGNGMQGWIVGAAYDTELGFGRSGIGWLFSVTFDRRMSARKGAPPQLERIHYLLRTLRSGIGDIEARIPATSRLAGKRVLLAGLGGIGAPVAMSLARNRLPWLETLDFDCVEPGTTVRWQFGASSWGANKGEFLKAQIERDFPTTVVGVHNHRIGMAVKEGGVTGKALARLVSDCDLVIDCTASATATNALWHLCSSAGKPLISAFATEDLKGAVVSVFTPGSGGPNCLAQAWFSRLIPPPPGLDDESRLMQPPGCADSTFVGADFDLQAISGQVMRCVTSSLATDASPGSAVHTASFVDADGSPCAPAWRRYSLVARDGCINDR